MREFNAGPDEGLDRHSCLTSYGAEYVHDSTF